MNQMAIALGVSSRSVYADQALICLGASTLFAAEAVYEQTLLTQAHGPQMLGFTLVMSTSVSCSSAQRGRKASTTEWLQLGASVFVLLMFWIPYEWWQFSTIQLAGPGSRAANQLKTPASSGHRYLADALLKGGLKIDSPDTDRHTALATAVQRGTKGYGRLFHQPWCEIGFRTREQAVFGLCCENETRSATTRRWSP